MMDPNEWEAVGVRRRLCGHDVFTVDLPPAFDERYEPLLIIHGFPTSSFDYSGIAERLSQHRRLLTLDLLGYGFSDKPDIPYTMSGQADVVVSWLEEIGVAEFAMLTHDMGDTVGGELFARQMEGEWNVDVTRRVVTNGSIYIESANLTAGQQLLLSLPDEKIEEPNAPGEDVLAMSLAATLAPGSAIDMRDHARLVCNRGGNQMLARTIRYIEERRAHQDRFTGAIETHPSPLGIVWGTEDPIAVRDMASRLGETRKDAALVWLDGIGHYPMIEAPAEFVDAVAPQLEG